MLKRIYPLLFAALLLMLAMPTFAQDATQPPPSDAAWTVSLFDYTSGTITRVAPTGDVISEFTLPTPEGFDSLNYYAVTSPSGNTIAYVVAQLGDGSTLIHTGQVVVYDTATDAVIATHDINDEIAQEGINAAANSLRFSADGTRLFFGYYLPTDDVGGSFMEFAVIDVATGEVVTTLNSDSLTDIMENPNTVYGIKTLSFADDVVTFTLRPVFIGIEGAGAAVIEWNIATNEVTAGARELLAATDVLASTGEALLVIYDTAADDLAEGETRLEAMQRTNNTVQLYDPATGEATTIFARDAEIGAAKFVQNGERILVLTGFGASGVLIERDGTVLQEYDILPGDTFVFGTPEGFIMTDRNQAGTLLAVTTTDDEFTPETFYTTDAPFTMLSVQDYQLIPPAIAG